MYTIIFVDPTVESLNKAKFGIDYIEIPPNRIAGRIRNDRKGKS